MIHINTFLLIGILCAVWMFGYIICALLSSGSRYDTEVENDLLSGSLVEKEAELKKLKEIKLQLEDRNKKLLDNIFNRKIRLS